ncbi:MAG: hypothetical protein JWP01_202 [Myxococcales bacterium]|nr:hypothetical protein [Myxococcales bacterium]
MDPAALPSSLGEFRIAAILGEGGSGIVYDATWGPRRVALKVLHPSLADTERIRAQFLNEAQRLQAITHPSVVKVLAVGELPDRRPYLAMERLEGETLASVLARGALPLAQALELFAELCHAVGTLHDGGLIHRDLKPENVFIVAGKHAVLLDFGIAKEVSAPASTTTMDGGVRGTPAYMAPERFFGQPAGIATDLYELAVTLYAMLAGRLPWDDLGDPEARLSPRPLIDFASVPDELDVEIRRALSTRAQNRPTSALAMLEEVRTAGRGSAPPLAAGETARMRPATADQVVKPTVTAERRPWFAERQNTTDRGKTPLAWAPTEHAEGAPVANVPRRRWPWIVGAVVVASAASGALIWRLQERDASRTAALSMPPIETAPVLPADQDPWGTPAVTREPAPVVPEITITGPEITMATAQAEVAKAIGHLPADTTMVIAGLIGPLRRDDRFAPIFDRLAKDPKVAMLAASVPPCVTSLIGTSEWFAFGSVGFRANEQGTLILRGRWQRAEVESCFAGQGEPLEMIDGARMLQLPTVGWLDFLDANTVYISVRQDLAAAQVHENVKRASGLSKHARELLRKLPADRVLTFVLDGSGKVEWPSSMLPVGSDAIAWMRPQPEQISFAMTMDVTSEDEAKKLETTLAEQIKGVFTSANAAMAKVEAKRIRSTVHVTGSMSSLMFGVVMSAALP